MIAVDTIIALLQLPHVTTPQLIHALKNAQGIARLEYQPIQLLDKQLIVSEL
jgi:hypothetical protein